MDKLLEQVLMADGDGVSVGVNSESVVYKNPDGSFSVCDNGEEVDNLTAEQAVRIIAENEEQAQS